MYLKWGYYMLMPILENISHSIKLQKGEKISFHCKLLSISLFPLGCMVIEVQNLIHDWKYTHI